MNSVPRMHAERTPPMPAIGENDLQLRLSLAQPSDTCKGMFFNGALGAVERTLGQAAREQCRAAGGEKKCVDFFNYPIAGFLQLSFVAAELLEEKVGSYDEAFRSLGQQAVDDFLASTVGKTLLMLAGKDPTRLLRSCPSAYRTAVSYGERKVEFTSERSCVFSMRRDFMPHPYHEGVFAQVIRALGVANVRVVGKRTGPLDADYAISWE